MVDTIDGEVVEVFYGREPEQANDPAFYADDGFDYVLVKLPRGHFPEAPGTISSRFAATQRPKIRVSLT